MLKFLSRLIWVAAEVVLVVALTVFVLLPMPVLSRISDITALVDSTSIVVRFVVLLVVYLVLIGLMFTQLRPRRRSKVDGLVVKAAGTVADLSVESAHEQIVRAVSDIPDVESVTCEIQSEGGKAVIELDVIVKPETMDIPAKQKEIDRTLKRVVNKQMGVQLASQPVVHMQLLTNTEPNITASDASVEAEPAFVAEAADAPAPATIEDPVPFDTADDDPVKVPAMDAPVTGLPLNADVVEDEDSDDGQLAESETDAAEISDGFKVAFPESADGDGETDKDKDEKPDAV